jgi:glutathione gamma-glutamylcysteinyltransferase
MDSTRYRRALPDLAVPFASDDGRALFAAALSAGGLDGCFSLAEQFHTQSHPSFCGPGSLVVALNALGIDPGRRWKGGWRWYSEDLLDCCVPLAEIERRGVTLDELDCLARCNGTESRVRHADASSLAQWRSAVRRAASGTAVVLASYDRAVLGQTGHGHFSPIGGFEPQRDLVLVLDVARFKYPAHWVPATALWQAMRTQDPATGRQRGWLELQRSLHSGPRRSGADCSGAGRERDAAPN